MYHITFPEQSNRASWVFTGKITDLNDNPIDLTGCTLVFEINDRDGCPRLMASTGNAKITIVDLGTFQWFFTLDDMHSLCAGTYQTGFTLTNDDGTQTVQLSVGPLPITEGIVP